MEEIKEFVKGLTFEQVVEKAKKEPYCFTLNQDDDLYMLSFTELTDRLSRNMNGVIFEKTTNKLLHYSFEKSYDSMDEYNGKFDKNCVVELSTSGSHIKLYYYQNEWKISTSRTINAAYTFWKSNKSFKEMFLECFNFEGFTTDNLDKTKCYSFIIQHPHLGHPTKYCQMLNYVDLENNHLTRTTEGFVTGMTVEEARKKSGNYIVFFPDSKRVKIDRFNSILLYTVDYIHETYMNLHVFKKEIEVYFKHTKVLKHLHYIYKKYNTKITKDIVSSVLLSLPSNYLKWTIDM